MWDRSGDLGVGEGTELDAHWARERVMGELCLAESAG